MGSANVGAPPTTMPSNPDSTITSFRPLARWMGVTLLLLATLLLASWPYVEGYRRAPLGTRFWAVPAMNAGDANQYTAFTRMVADGQLLVGDPFTSEPNAPRLFLPQVHFQALLCRQLHLTPLDAFQVSRVLSGAVLLAAATWFGFLLVRRWSTRWLYLGLLCFSAGASWWLERFGVLLESGDHTQPESNTFYSLGNLPHVALAAGLLTALFGTLAAYERDRRAQWLWLTAGLSFLLSWTHPFDYLPLGLGLVAYLAVRWLSSRRFPTPSGFHLAATLGGALPAGLYLTWVTRTDPVYAALASDTLKVKPFLYYAIAHAPLGLAALGTLLHPILRKRLALPLCWVLCAFLFLTLPFRLGGKQPRVVGGVHAPLALLAAAGADAFARRAVRLARRGGRTGAWAPVLAGGLNLTYLGVVATGGWGIWTRHREAYARVTPFWYQTPGMQTVLQALDRSGSRADLTLGGELTGGWAPTWADTRVYEGHWHMTLNRPVKLAERNWFFMGTTDPRFFTGQADPAARSRWLKERGIRWIVYYPWEWGDGQQIRIVPLDAIPGVRAVRQAADVSLYRFDPPSEELPP